MQKACTPGCALDLVRTTKTEKAAKAQRKSDRVRREAMKTRGDLTREAQAAFCAFIRASDYGQPCISSGRLMDWNKLGGAVDAGHYRSVGSSPENRFNCWNCHAQSVHDNRDLSGNAVEYRKMLILRIGLERVEALECDNTPRNYNRDDLVRIKRLFSKRARHYRKIKGISG